MGESSTVVSAYTRYRHLQQYCSHPPINIIRFGEMIRCSKNVWRKWGKIQIIRFFKASFNWSESPWCTQPPFSSLFWTMINSLAELQIEGGYFDFRLKSFNNSAQNPVLLVLIWIVSLRRFKWVPHKIGFHWEITILECHHPRVSRELCIRGVDLCLLMVDYTGAISPLGAIPPFTTLFSYVVPYFMLFKYLCNFLWG